ncbi:MAG: hypothetical protein ACOYON_00380 [Fimbriimonas sp.]
MKKRQLLAALQEPWNTVGMAAAIGISAATLNPLPFLIALVAEAAYLLFVPDSKWYEARLSARYDAEVSQRIRDLASKIFPSLADTTKSRFVRLQQLRTQIDGVEFAGKHWFREVLRKLDYLLEKFLLFASKEVQFQNYLRSVLQDVEKAIPQVSDGPPPIRSRSRRNVEYDVTPTIDEAWVRRTVKSVQEDYQEEIDKLDGLIRSDENLHNQAILEKRKEVLARRKEYVAQIGDILTNLKHQLSLMEDTFGLINDEIRARSPEQVLADIEDVVFQTNVLTETLNAVSPFDEMAHAPGASKLYELPPSNPL